MRRTTRASMTFVASRRPPRPASIAAAVGPLAASHFQRVESVPEPHAARVRALELAGADGRILVAGSLYLLADLYETDVAFRMHA